MIDETTGDNIAFEERDGEKTAIDGSGVMRMFLLLREGWEADEDSWILEDGRVFGTSHGALCAMDEDGIERVMEKVAAALSGLLEVRAAMKGRSADTDGGAVR